jgi:hypothetical protein
MYEIEFKDDQLYYALFSIYDKFKKRIKSKGSEFDLGGEIMKFKDNNPNDFLSIWITDEPIFNYIPLIKSLHEKKTHDNTKTESENIDNNSNILLEYIIQYKILSTIKEIHLDTLFKLHLEFKDVENINLREDLFKNLFTLINDSNYKELYELYLDSLDKPEDNQNVVNDDFNIEKYVNLEPDQQTENVPFEFMILFICYFIRFLYKRNLVSNKTIRLDKNENRIKITLDSLEMGIYTFEKKKKE